MASACVNNNISMSPDTFPPPPPPPTCPSYGWLSPRISFSREDDANAKQRSSSSADPLPPEIQDPPPPAVDFEFRLEDHPVTTMLAADELFSDGKLVPLQITNVVKPSSSSSCSSVNALAETRPPEAVKPCRRTGTAVAARTTDPYPFSPKAPKCSSRWRELLGLKKLYQQNPSNPKSETHKAAAAAAAACSSPSLSSTSSNHSKSLKHFLHRNSKYCSCNAMDHSLSQPLLKDSDCESVSISSSRLSLSSSSSSHEHEDLPRLSLDSEKPNPLQQNPNPNPFVLNRNNHPNHQNPTRMKLVKPRSEIENHHHPNGWRTGKSPMRRTTAAAAAAAAATESLPSSAAGVNSSGRGVSVDSPRMNSSGKIVFQSLERSSSSPSSFNGGPRFKQRGMERSYSANVRITPVLNVPVCSLRGSSKSVSVFGFGQLFSSSPHKREGSSKSHQRQQQKPSAAAAN